MSIGKKTIDGLFWNSLSFVSLKVINFLISIILARLLEPSDFGVVGIALLFINFFEIARDLGIGAALIHKQEDIDTAANTAFFIFPAIAFFLYIFIYLSAPTVAFFFNNSGVEIVLKVLAITLILWSFGNLPRTLLQKDLDFKKLFLPQIVPRLGYGFVSVALAFTGYGVWSLVFGRVTLEILALITTWRSIEWRPTFTFNSKIAIELLSYGKHALIASISAFAISAIDISVVGKYLGAENLGFYSMAISISTFFTIQISTIMSVVLFPAYSKMQDTDKIADGYLKTLRLMSLITFPAAFGMIGVSLYFVELFLGDKWLPIVTVLKILCICGISKSILNVSGSLYLASGNAKTSSKINRIQLTFIGILIIPLTIRYGIEGAGFAVAIPSTITLYFMLREASKIIERKLSIVVATFLHPLSGSIIMFLGISSLQKLFFDLQPLYVLILSIILGMIIYFIYVSFTMKKDLVEIASICKHIHHKDVDKQSFVT
jgi:O-antigen/teichoic acid export membrane protein